MNINQITQEITKKFEKSKIGKNSQLEAELLISTATKLKREEIISQPKKEIDKKGLRIVNKLIKKRIEGWPLAYLSGYKNFYNLEFIVNKHVLIPRPESELIIDDILNLEIKQETIIIDIGTGSGCLIISLADILKHKKNISFYASDISSKALKLAKKNAKNHNCIKEIKFLKGNLLKAVKKKHLKSKSEIIIIANLPYLNKKELKNSPSIKFEPFKALYGGKDGLKYYRKLLDQIKKIKKENNIIRIYKEINPWQEEKLKNIIDKKLSKYNPEIKTLKDLSGQERLIISKII